MKPKLFSIINTEKMTMISKIYFPNAILVSLFHSLYSNFLAVLLAPKNKAKEAHRKTIKMMANIIISMICGERTPIRLSSIRTPSRIKLIKNPAIKKYNPIRILVKPFKEKLLSKVSCMSLVFNC